MSCVTVQPQPVQHAALQSHCSACASSTTWGCLQVLRRSCRLTAYFRRWLCFSCPIAATGRGRSGSSPGQSFYPASDPRTPQFARGQLYEAPQQRQTGGFGVRGRIQQPAHVPQQQHQQHRNHSHDGHSMQQHGSENQQGHFGRGRGGSRGLGRRGRGYS